MGDSGDIEGWGEIVEEVRWSKVIQYGMWLRFGVEYWVVKICCIRYGDVVILWHKGMSAKSDQMGLGSRTLVEQKVSFCSSSRSLSSFTTEINNIK